MNRLRGTWNPQNSITPPSEPSDMWQGNLQVAETSCFTIQAICNVGGLHVMQCLLVMSAASVCVEANPVRKWSVEPPRTREWYYFSMEEVKGSKLHLFVNVLFFSPLFNIPIFFLSFFNLWIESGLFLGFTVMLPVRCYSFR